jgi:predicted cupin superfamily sugar epimerase
VEAEVIGARRIDRDQDDVGAPRRLGLGFALTSSDCEREQAEERDQDETASGLSSSRESSREMEKGGLPHAGNIERPAPGREHRAPPGGSVGSDEGPSARIRRGAIEEPKRGAKGMSRARESESQGALSAEVRSLIERLELGPHPEGGWYRETWRSPVVLGESALPRGYAGERRMMTAILFLLPSGARSRLHCVRSEELWLHHRGDDLRLGIGATPAAAEDPANAVLLGQGDSARLQAVVPPGDWQQAEALPGPSGFALVGCVVAPGFEFADFEMLRGD